MARSRKKRNRKASIGTRKSPRLHKTEISEDKPHASASENDGKSIRSARAKKSETSKKKKQKEPSKGKSEDNPDFAVDDVPDGDKKLPASSNPSRSGGNTFTMHGLSHLAQSKRQSDLGVPAAASSRRGPRDEQQIQAGNTIQHPQPDPDVSYSSQVASSRCEESDVASVSNRASRIGPVPANNNAVIKNEYSVSTTNQHSSSTTPVWNMVSRDPMNVITKRIVTVYERRHRRLSNEGQSELGKELTFYHSKIYFKIDLDSDTLVYDMHEPKRCLYDGECNAARYVANHFDCRHNEIDYSNNTVSLQKLRTEYRRQVRRHLALGTVTNENNVTNIYWSNRSFEIVLFDICKNNIRRTILSEDVHYCPDRNRLSIEANNAFSASTNKRLMNLAFVYLDEPYANNTTSFLEDFDNSA